MTEGIKTLLCVGVGVALFVLGSVIRPKPESISNFSDEGESFFPEFTQAEEAVSLEVISYDEGTALADTFKVEWKEGKWVLPLHEDFPADAEEKIKNAAVSALVLKKDVFQTDRSEDHPRLEVVDPVDERVETKGRGRKVVFRNKGGRVLAEFILGKKHENKKGFRYVRLPDKKRVYAVRVDPEGTKDDLDLSTKLEDWIQEDLLQADRYQVKQIKIDRYTVNERTRQVVPGEVIVLRTPEGGWDWNAEGMGENEEVSLKALNPLLDSLKQFKLADVARRPPMVGSDLMLPPDVSDSDLAQTAADMQPRGFFFVGDGDRYRLKSNEGEVHLWTDRGVKYTLCFGELASTPGAKEERRYVFLTAMFDEAFLPEPVEEDKKEEWKRKVEEGKKKAEELQAQYKDWFYIIPGELFQKFRLTRAELIIPKAKGEERKDH